MWWGDYFKGIIQINARVRNRSSRMKLMGKSQEKKTRDLIKEGGK